MKIFLTRGDGEGPRHCEVIEIPDPEPRPCRDCGTTISDGARCDDCAIELAIEKGIIDRSEGDGKVAVRTISMGPRS